jgi:hypothetical protein
MPRFVRLEKQLRQLSGYPGQLVALADALKRAAELSRYPPLLRLPEGIRSATADASTSVSRRGDARAPGQDGAVAATLRESTQPEEWPALNSGYRLEIERMQGEILSRAPSRVK